MRTGNGPFKDLVEVKMGDLFAIKSLKVESVVLCRGKLLTSSTEHNRNKVFKC